MINASTAPNAPNSVGWRSRAATTVSTYATALAMLVAAATPPAVATRAFSRVPRFCFTVASASMGWEDSVADASSVSPERPPYPWPLLAWCVGLAALVLAPLARPGFLLSYDMVTVPQQELVPDALGLGSALPRAVPLDAVMAVLTQVVPGELVYRAALVGILAGGAIGAAMLLPRASGTVRAVAASAYVWNAYVAERLVIGHWGLLVGYAVLPWLLRAGLAVRHGDRAALPNALVLVALASVTPTGGVLATGVLVVVVALPGRRQRWPAALAAAGCVVLQLPWLGPGVLEPPPSASGPPAGQGVPGR